MELWQAILVALLLAAIAGGVAWYLALQRGKAEGVETERTRQAGVLASAEEQASRLLVDADARIKAQQLALKEEEVRQRTELDNEAVRRRKA